MAKEKVKSPVVVKAESRLSGMQLIDQKAPKPVNYGSEKEPVTVITVEAKILQVAELMVEYNKCVKTLDGIGNRYDAAEKELNDICTKILSGGLAQFGGDSDEYEQLGGTRTSDRKKPAKTKKETK